MEMEYPSHKPSSPQADVNVEQMQTVKDTAHTAYKSGTGSNASRSTANGNLPLQSSNLLLMQRQLGNQAVKQLIMQTRTHAIQSSLSADIQPAWQVDASVPLSTLDHASASHAQPFDIPDSASELTSTLNGGSNRVLQAKFIYTNTARLSRSDGQANVNKVNNYKIHAIKLPASFRPPTQFGQAQMAHSISWTLLKKGYESVHEMDANDFIINYLKKDWSALREQLNVIKSRQNEASLAPQLDYTDFTKYANKYSDDYFDHLLQKDDISLQWVANIQQAVSDYFVALQLAPLTTHTGFTQKKGKAGVNESKPSGHGEPAANLVLTKLEATIAQAPSYVPNPQHQMLVEKAAAMYWDPGADNINGISDENELKLLRQEYGTAFQRVYPKIWKFYQKNVESKLGANSIPANESESVAELINVAKTINKDELEEELEEQQAEQEQAEAEVNELSTPSNFRALVDLQDKEEADNKVPASVFNIDELLLSNDRPPTKYGPIGQKSHTVSWSLTLNALSQIGEHRPLTNMLIDMSLKWDHLAAQSWNEMLSDSLIAKSDFQAINMSDQTYEKHLKNNKDRLQEINELIVINQNKVQHALNDLELSELGWQSFIQTMVSDYVIAYQSAPLTSAKMGKPDGRGEADANKYLDLLDQNYTEKASDSSAIINDPHAVAQQYVHHDILLKKFKSEFTKEKINKYNKDTQKSIVELKEKAKKVIDQKQQTTNPTTLSQEDWDKMMTLLAVHEALKHMEVNWKLFQGKDYNSQYKRTAMASILHEWEQSIENSYPNIKLYIFNSLKEYSDSMLISEGMQKEERNDNAANKDWKLEPTLKRDMDKLRKSHTDQRKHLLNKHQEDSSNLKKRSFLEAQKTHKQEDATSDMEQIAKHQKLNSESEDQQNQQDMLSLGSQSSTGSTIGQNNQLIGLPPANPLSAFSFTPPPSFNFNLNLTQLPNTFSSPSSLMNGSFQQQAQNDMMPALQTSAMEDIEEAEEEQQHKNDEGSMSNF